jgi:hypothetical protein
MLINSDDFQPQEIIAALNEVKAVDLKVEFDFVPRNYRKVLPLEIK